MKNYKTLIITIAAIAAVLIMMVFAVQGAGNKAIGYEVQPYAYYSTDKTDSEPLTLFN